MISTAFKTTGDAASPQPQWIPPDPTVGAFTSVLGNDATPVVRWLLNSVLAAGRRC
jgi:multiple sugar transport system permease protein